jgi:hypothetical protein
MDMDMNIAYFHVHVQDYVTCPSMRQFLCSYVNFVALVSTDNFQDIHIGIDMDTVMDTDNLSGKYSTKNENVEILYCIICVCLFIQL